MTKIQKIGSDGKMHDYWQYTPEEVAFLKRKFEDRKQKRNQTAEGQPEEES